ncbi:deleted in azoospermia protein 1-like isoform X2 [Anoplophora glabripennis]|uniref:deleted in azoospermia protein 1-like isoform X2 n=1 Tax=Anoplophora glabripennis TaxID=217634 RepID=UPI0008745F5E|nr:deleted in azoospermia protein 1-like isoform X2 [Anoplophora glabripennis]
MPEKMSTSSQNNGKKSSNSSIVNTPSSTPLTGIANGNTQANTQGSPPPNNNAPKYGTLVPNRIFVGGISANTTESELMQLFSSYGTVKAAKIIQDRAGVSKGYGFITFESEDDAKRPLREAENIVLRERKLNIAPAIKKQPVYQPPPVYPSQTGPPQTATYPSMMFPAQTIYMPQQYPMPMPYDYNYYQSNGAPPSAQYMVGNQGGSGGPQCPPLPPSGSPPRPPCYGQQMPAYSPADPMFYNLPVYGATMEVPPVYTEAFDLGAGGPYGEDAFSNMADNIIAQDIDLSLSLPFITPNEINHNHPPPLPLPNVANDPAATDKPATHFQAANGNPPHPEERNTTTPVVSLLSIDHQQEKDYLSMRGGRRRKSGPPTVPNNPRNPHGFLSNGYTSPLSTYSVGFHPQTYNPFGNNGGFSPNRANGLDGRMNRTRPRGRAYDRRSNDHSSRSSLRTDSNSSASCVDENRNEEKPRMNAASTPPPAPYSPISPHMKILHNTVSREFHNIARYATNYRPPYNHHHNINNINDKTHPNPSDSPLSPHSSISQVHVTASQSFAPQARRSRRSIRRGGPAGVSEIGAGDAPLPNDDVCKKFETLKL